MAKRYLAVTQLELNLRFSEAGEPTRHFLQALLLDPSAGWRAQPFDLRYPGSSEDADTGEFIVSAVGDLDGDGRCELVYAVTIAPADCHILAYRHDGTDWRALPIIKGLPSVDLVRSIALGDLDQDGADEIVLGTRPSGAVLVLDGGPTGYAVTTIDRDQYGTGTTNTREVAVADVDGDGALEILVATAHASLEKWQATPGALFLYRRSADGWDRILIDDHGGRTHTRMVAVADVKNDGVKRIVSSAVGVVEPESGRIDPQPELRMYTLTGERAACQPIGTLENMIKSRSFAAGDIDGNGSMALVVGTRALGAAGLETTCLFVYRFDAHTQAWERETLDTSGSFGFHCVAIADVDGDGRSEVIASDDGRGLIKLYKKRGDGWQREIIYAAKGAIFCSAIHLIQVESASA
ncbi:MAG: hypothetical protein QOG83_2518 [Alphaproteobacteria bacterium]|nr:hypothetical protein [Alphaproteobacteria bacterium]